MRMPSVHALTVWVGRKIKWLSISWFTLDLAVGVGKKKEWFS